MIIVMRPTQFIHVICTSVCHSSVYPLRRLNGQYKGASATIVAKGTSEFIPIVGRDTIRPTSLRLRPTKDVLRTIKRYVCFRVVPLRCQEGRSIVVSLTDVVILHLPTSMVIATHPKDCKPAIIILPRGHPRVVQRLTTIQLSNHLSNVSLRRVIRVGRYPRVAQLFVFVR